MCPNLCLHCLEEGEWEDEDVCPSCTAAGHVGPWKVGGCPACNKPFFDKIDELKRRVDERAIREGDYQI